MKIELSVGPVHIVVVVVVVTNPAKLKDTHEPHPTEGLPERRRGCFFFGKASFFKSIPQLRMADPELAIPGKTAAITPEAPEVPEKDKRTKVWKVVKFILGTRLTISSQ